jgi:hypothetical protein
LVEDDPPVVFIEHNCGGAGKRKLSPSPKRLRPNGWPFTYGYLIAPLFGVALIEEALIKGRTGTQSGVLFTIAIRGDLGLLLGAVITDSLLTGKRLFRGGVGKLLLLNR